jgi:hypothetical protein
LCLASRSPCSPVGAAGRELAHRERAATDAHGAATMPDITALSVAESHQAATDTATPSRPTRLRLAPPKKRGSGRSSLSPAQWQSRRARSPSETALLPINLAPAGCTHSTYDGSMNSTPTSVTPCCRGHARRGVHGSVAEVVDWHRQRLPGGRSTFSAALAYGAAEHGVAAIPRCPHMVAGFRRCRAGEGDRSGEGLGIASPRR